MPSASCPTASAGVSARLAATGVFKGVTTLGDGAPKHVDITFFLRRPCPFVARSAEPTIRFKWDIRPAANPTGVAAV